MAKNDANLLDEEFKHFLDHQKEIVEQYNGRIVVIKNGQIIGAYDSEGEALTETRKDHDIGTFLIQRVSPGEEAYTQTFHSRLRS